MAPPSLKRYAWPSIATILLKGIAWRLTGSVEVIGAVGLVWLTGWLVLDPVIALLAAANIVWTGWQLMQRSAAGLMDSSLPADKLAQIHTLVDRSNKNIT